MEAKFLRKHRETQTGIWSFFFSKPSGFRHDAGDYIEVELSHRNAIGTRRWFTVASAPRESTIQITTRVPFERASNFKQQFAKLRPGDAIRVSPAMGNFNLPAQQQPSKLLFIAGGVGITPYRAMAVEQPADEDRDIELLYAAKPGEFLFTDELTRIARIKTTTARVTLPQVQATYADLDERLVYLAGPEIMMESLHNQLLDAGQPRNLLRLSYFEGLNNL